MFERYGLKRTGQAVAALAVTVMIADIYLSASFGFSINLISTLIYGAVSAASGLLLVLAAIYYRQSTGWNFERVLAVALCAAWFPAFGFNVWSNMGVATAGRIAEVQKASHTEKVFQGKEDTLKKAENTLGIFEKRRDELISARGWAAQVPAGVIEKKIAAYPGIQRNIWDRTKQCTDATIPASIAYCKEYRSLEADLEASKAVDKLNKQIAATERVIETAKTTIADADQGISNTKNQVSIHAKLIRWWNGDSDVWAANIESEELVAANEGMGIFSSFILALVAAVLGLALTWPKIKRIRPSSDIDDIQRPSGLGGLSKLSVADLPSASQAAQSGITLRETTVGDRNRQKVREMLAAGRVRLEGPVAA